MKCYNLFCTAVLFKYTIKPNVSSIAFKMWILNHFKTLIWVILKKNAQTRKLFFCEIEVFFILSKYFFLPSERFKIHQAKGMDKKY